MVGLRETEAEAVSADNTTIVSKAVGKTVSGSARTDLGGAPRGPAGAQRGARKHYFLRR